MTVLERKNKTEGACFHVWYIGVIVEVKNQRARSPEENMDTVQDILQTRQDFRNRVTYRSTVVREKDKTVR